MAIFKCLEKPTNTWQNISALHLPGITSGMFPHLAFHKGGSLQCFSVGTQSSILTRLQWVLRPTFARHESEESMNMSVAPLMPVIAIHQHILHSGEISGGGTKVQSF